MALTITTTERIRLDVGVLSPASLPSLRYLELNMVPEDVAPNMANLSRLTQLDSLALTDILPSIPHDNLPSNIRHLRLDLACFLTDPTYETCTEVLRAFRGSLLTLCIPAPYLCWGAPVPNTPHYLSELASLQSLVHLELGVCDEAQPQACEFRLPVLKYLAINVRLDELPMLLPWDFAACPSLRVFMLDLEPQQQAHFDVRDLCSVCAPLVQVKGSLGAFTDELLSLQLRPQTFACLEKVKVIVDSEPEEDISGHVRQVMREQFEGSDVDIE